MERSQISLSSLRTMPSKTKSFCQAGFPNSRETMWRSYHVQILRRYINNNNYNVILINNCVLTNMHTWLLYRIDFFLICYTTAYVCMAAILLAIILLVPMDQWCGKFVVNDSLTITTLFYHSSYELEIQSVAMKYQLYAFCAITPTEHIIFE